MNDAPTLPTGKPGPETRLLRRTRRQLVLWSSGSTMIVLVLLGAALYTAVAGQLASSSQQRLEARAAATLSHVPHEGDRHGPDGFPQPPNAGSDPGSPGFLTFGPLSGTVGYIIDPTLVTSSSPVPDWAGYRAALAGRTVTNETTFVDTAVRVYSTPVAVGGSTQVVQILASRVDEVRTLQELLFVLLVGGLLVVLAAAAVGWVYAGRALVPIRDSLRRQREFAADASHELRTPLTVIRGNVQLLKRNERSPTEAEALEDVDAEVTRMTSLVEQLLLLARTDSDVLELELGACDMAEEAADALEAFAPIAESKGTHLALDVEPAPLNGDRSRLRQLAGILIDNAIRHSPRDGTVHVGVHNAHGRAILAVEDQGPGIKPEDLPRVFDRFWRAADAPEGGSGLGLAIAAWIVERHGGTIRAENRPSGGARFIAELPASRPSGDDRGLEERPARRPWGLRQRSTIRVER